MRVKDIQHLAETNKGTLLGVFNPTNKDFTWAYDNIEYTIPKGEMVKFEYHIAHHLAKHLIDKILTDKGLNTGKKEDREEWMAKILI